MGFFVGALVVEALKFSYDFGGIRYNECKHNHWSMPGSREGHVDHHDSRNDVWSIKFKPITYLLMPERPGLSGRTVSWVFPSRLSLA